MNFELLIASLCQINMFQTIEKNDIAVLRFIHLTTPTFNFLSECLNRACGNRIFVDSIFHITLDFKRDTDLKSPDMRNCNNQFPLTVISSFNSFAVCAFSISIKSVAALPLAFALLPIWMSGTHFCFSMASA